MVALKKAVQRFEVAEPATPFAADVLKGLKSTPKRISPKYFYDAAGSALFEKITDLHRLGEPEDVVGPVAFFASDDSAFVTGQALNVDGGIFYS